MCIRDRSNGCSINIIGRNGDITITAQSNGDVKITAKNIIIDADEDIDLNAGGDINLTASNKIILRSAIANCDALAGNLAPRDVTFAGLVTKGTKIGVDGLDKVLGGWG